jgi:SAM-dependent methyltransferase
MVKMGKKRKTAAPLNLDADMAGSETVDISGTHEPTTHYSAAQHSANYSPGVENIYWHLARNQIVETQIRASGGRRVLDIGCGRGILVDYLLGRGIDCYGVELTKISVPPSLDQRLFSGITAEQLPQDLRDSIDTLFLGDVIEHLPNPIKTLQSILAVFPRVTSLVVAVPARQELWSNYDEYYGHYRRYDLALLRETMEAVGFSVSELRYMFRLLYLPMRLLRSLGGSRNTRIRPPFSRIVHRFVAAVIYADFVLLPPGVYGSSAICRATRHLPGVCRK